MRPFVAALLFASFTAHGVTLNPDGLGQALIYPYYTVQSAAGNAFNTYITIVNHSADAKVLRVRFREARTGAEVLAFNLFLGARDAWAAAVVPLSSGTRLVTTDTSCTDPAFTAGSPPFMDFRANAYQGDGSGDGIERTREGFVEILEMGTVDGVHRAAVSLDLGLGTRNCAQVQENPNVTVSPPTGDVSGTLTLINVASGLDFTLNAEALAGLSTRAYFRVATDPYPDFNAAELDAVSEVTANGVSYRSTWPRSADAVSAVLMRSRWLAEYVLDSATASVTDLVLTFPTRRFYATAGSANAPFTRPLGWTADCLSPVSTVDRGERFDFVAYTREENAFAQLPPFPSGPPAPALSICASAAAFSVVNGGSHMPGLGQGSGVLGAAMQRPVFLQSFMQNGWLELFPASNPALSSLESSTRVNASTGFQTFGPHEYRGLPVVGFSARIFRNGTLQCSAGACQGNYGSAWPLRFRRSISPAS